MDNKDRNTNPADNGIVTKKGFLISPPKKVKATAKLEFASAKDAQTPEKPAQQHDNKKHQKHESFEQFEKSREKDGDERKSGDFRKKNHRNRKPGRKDAANAPKDQNTGNTTVKNENNKNQVSQPVKKGGKAPFGKNVRDNQKKQEMHAEIEKTEQERSANKHNRRNDNRKNRENHKSEKHNQDIQRKEQPANGKEKRPLGNESVLRDLGFVSDSFTKKNKITESVKEDAPAPAAIDYSKAIPLRDQIYPEKKAEQPKAFEGEGCEIIGVRFKEAGKIYYFDPDGKEVSYGTPVIVETARGMEYGFTAIANRFIPTDDIISPLKKIVRLATKEDKERLDANKILEKDAEHIFREKTAKLGLEMGLVGVEYTFDNTKLLFYFVADGRVDFRELVKELAAVFHTRIELRQVGVRDQAKVLGGLGVCGRALCCKTFLGEFAQVSIKMAKDQNLSLNSAKISGTCGRLLCCLRYEDEVYQKEYERTPKVDAIVDTPEGKGVVIEANPLKGTVRVQLESKADTAPQTFHRDSVTIVGYAKKSDNTNDDELKELEKE